MGRYQKKILAAMLSIGLMASAQTPAVFADESVGDAPDGQVVKQETEAVTPESSIETLKENEAEAPKKAITLKEDPSEADPEADHVLKGTVYEHEYNKGTDQAKPSSGKAVKITLGDGSTETVTSGSDGSFRIELDDAKTASSGSYAWSFAKDADYLAASGTIKEGETSKLYIKERYEPKSSDYSFADSDDIISQILRKAGIYTIVPADGKKLAKTQDGEAKSSLQVQVADDGTVEDFYVYIGSDCSKALSGEKAKIDDGAPKINTVSTSPADGDTYVKSHGIYSKTKAGIIVNAEITEKGVGLKKVYLVGKKDDKTTTYDPVSSDHSKGEYTYSIALPEEETILDAEKMYLVAEDLFGNKSQETLIAQSEDGSSVTLEAIAPDLNIKVSSSPNANGWYNSLPTVTASASDNLSGLASLILKEDGNELAKTEPEDKAKDEKSVSAKAVIEEPSKNGAYTFTAEAKDNSGNEIKKDKVLKIDLVAPKIEASGVKTGDHYRSVPAIKVTEDEMYYDADGAHISYSISLGGSQTISKTVNKVKELTIPTSLFDKDGVYKVAINAKDAAGNGSNTITYEFTKDSKAPAVTWSGVKNGKFYNKKQTATLTVKEHNYKTDNVSVSAVKKRGNATSNVGFPWSNKGETSSSSKTFSDIGTYTLKASATDKAGNSSGQKTLTFTVDTKAPEITITGVKDGGVYTYGQGVAPGYKVTDDYPDKESVSYTKGGAPVSKPSFEQVKENDGLYTMTVTATDKAGNTTTKQISFVVNRFGSWFEYNDAIKNLQGKAVQNVENDLVITEHNVSKVTESEALIYRDGQAAPEKGTTSPDESGPEKIYRHTFTAADFSKEGAYEINVRSKDEVGNEMESKEETGLVKFFVDRTAPNITLSGIDPKGNKAESITVDIGASDTLTGISGISASVDGENVTVNKTDSGEVFIKVGEGMRQTVKITATDGAGNTAEVTETASVSSSAFKLFINRFLWPIIGAALALLAGIIFLIVKRKRDEEEYEEDE